MKVYSKKPKGQRIFKCMKFWHPKFGKITRPFNIHPVENDWWFNLKTGEWQQSYPYKSPCTNHFYAMEHSGYKNIYSFKAALRTIRKWNVPIGTKFMVSSPFVGYYFIVTK